MSNIITLENARRTSSAKKIRACAAWSRDIAEATKKATYKDLTSESVALKNADRLNSQAEQLENLAAQM